MDRWIVQGGSAAFGDEQKLFDAVVGRALDELAEAVPLKAGDDPAEYVGRVYDFHRDNPVLVRLFFWEGLHYRDGVLPNEERRRGHYEEKIAVLAENFGTEASPKIAACLLSLIGLAAWPNAVPQLTRLIIGTDTEELDLRSHVVAFARQALSGTAAPALMATPADSPEA
ncbi:TetR/AcrR family transcriptional regulator [Streptomyces brevispora]|uniref:TetR/AcrR family transcriptional regulator n=1 Tax=Streptomyces brevispora TaxID=887462 RepID=UPI003724A766